MPGIAFDFVSVKNFSRGFLQEKIVLIRAARQFLKCKVSIPPQIFLFLLRYFQKIFVTRTELKNVSGFFQVSFVM